MLFRHVVLDFWPCFFTGSVRDRHSISQKQIFAFFVDKFQFIALELQKHSVEWRWLCTRWILDNCDDRSVISFITALLPPVSKCKLKKTQGNILYNRRRTGVRLSLFLPHILYVLASSIQVNFFIYSCIFALFGFRVFQLLIYYFIFHWSLSIINTFFASTI